MDISIRHQEGSACIVSVPFHPVVAVSNVSTGRQRRISSRSIQRRRQAGAASGRDHIHGRAGGVAGARDPVVLEGFNSRHTCEQSAHGARQASKGESNRSGRPHLRQAD
jgi:hypothetical protein